jgi:uncharacterized membrane protein YccF (DUF307 family)
VGINKEKAIMGTVSLLGNIVWLIFGGFFAAAGYILGGLALCLTIIGIPLGIAAIQLGINTLFPFGKSLRHQQGGTGCVAVVLNIIWIITFGWALALTHLIFGVMLGVTIIGIPFAVQHFKLIPVAFAPFTYTLD